MERQLFIHKPETDTPRPNEMICSRNHLGSLFGSRGCITWSACSCFHKHMPCALFQKFINVRINPTNSAETIFPMTGNVGANVGGIRTADGSEAWWSFLWRTGTRDPRGYLSCRGFRLWWEWTSLWKIPIKLRRSSVKTTADRISSEKFGAIKKERQRHRIGFWSKRRVLP